MTFTSPLANPIRAANKSLLFPHITALSDERQHYNSRRTDSVNMPPYTLVVHLHAKPDCVEKLAEKLKEASQVYSNDRECLSW